MTSTFLIIYVVITIVLIILIIITVLYFLTHKKIDGIWCKKSKEYYENKVLKRDGYCNRNGQKHGYEHVYYPSGELNKIQHWRNGFRDGEFTVYFKNGSVYIKGVYRNGEIVQQDINIKKA